MTRATLIRHTILAAAAITGAAAPSLVQRSTDRATAFTNVTVVDVRTGRLEPNSTIVIRGNRIRNTARIRAVVTNGRHLDRQALDALLATPRPPR